MCEVDMSLWHETKRAQARIEVLQVVLGYILCALGQTPEHRQDLLAVLDGLRKRLDQKENQAQTADDLDESAREAAALSVSLLRQFLLGERPI